MALINQGGKLLLRDGKLGTGQGCCCGQCNPSTCPAGTECTPPCVCVNGQCVQGGACCLPDGTCQSGLTQEECEACEAVNNCYEYLYLEDPEQPCPEGWQGGGGFCSRTTTVASCGECSGWCEPTQAGLCGKFVAARTCDTNPCNCCCVDGEPDPEKQTQEDCEAAGGSWVDRACAPNLCNCIDECLSHCTYQPGDFVADMFQDHVRLSGIAAVGPSLGPEFWKAGYPAALSNCTMVWVGQDVAQTPGSQFAIPCGGSSTIKQYRFWTKYRLFVVDCQSQQLREVSAEALVDVPYHGTSFGSNGFCPGQVPPLTDPTAPWLDYTPQLICT